MQFYNKQIRAIFYQSTVQIFWLTLICLLCPFCTRTIFAQTTYDESYGLIELSNVPNPDQRTTLSEAGITLLDYLYGLTWTASFDNPVDPAQIELVVSIEELQSSAKVSSSFEAFAEMITSNSVDTEIEVRVRSWDGTNEYMTQYGTIISEDWLFTIVRLDEDVVEVLADHPNTRWVEPVFPIVSLEEKTVPTTSGALLADVNNEIAMMEITVGIFDRGRVFVVPDNEIFVSRVTTETFTIPAVGNFLTGDEEATDVYGNRVKHATAVASVLNNESSLTHINSYFYGDQEPLITEVVDIALQVIGNGSCRESGKYTSVSYQFDSYDLPIVVSVGNYGESCPAQFFPRGYGTVSMARQSAKNVITVGATDANETPLEKSLIGLSSMGPTRDGRIAPTFVEQGENVSVIRPPNGGDDIGIGTSFSASIVASGLSLLLDEYRTLVDDETAKLSSADVKALFAATAFDLGRTGPDYQYGFGLPNISRAIAVLPNLRHFETVGSDEEDRDFIIPVDETIESLNVVLTWNDLPFDPVAHRLAPFTPLDHEEFAEQGGLTRTVLINDLELTVTAPDGTIHSPFTLNPDVPTETATTGIDSVNTIEQVVVHNPQAGDWTVSVGHSGEIIPTDAYPSQKYSVVYATIPVSSIPLSVTHSPPSTTSSDELSTIVFLLGALTAMLLKKQYDTAR